MEIVSMTHPATARWLATFILLLGACRGGDEPAGDGAEKTAPPGLEIPALPDFGPLGDLSPDTEDGTWALAMGSLPQSNALAHAQCAPPAQCLA